MSFGITLSLIVTNHKKCSDFEYKNLPPKGAKKKVKWVDRKIVTGRPDLQLKHNGISTSKYNFVTFIPRNLMEQFSKIANIYFLVIIQYTETGSNLVFLGYWYHAIDNRNFCNKWNS